MLVWAESSSHSHSFVQIYLPYLLYGTKVLIHQEKGNNNYSLRVVVGAHCSWERQIRKNQTKTKQNTFTPGGGKEYVLGPTLHMKKMQEHL